MIIAAIEFDHRIAPDEAAHIRDLWTEAESSKAKTAVVLDAGAHIKWREPTRTISAARLSVARSKVR